MKYPIDGDGALYELAADPEEIQNLYGDPGLAEVRRTLYQTMKETDPSLTDQLLEER